MRTEALSPSSGAWREALSRVEHDFYHLPEYAAVEARRLEGRAVAVLARSGDDWLLTPVVIRPALLAGERVEGELDACSPYGYASPLVHVSRSSSGFELEALRQSISCLAELGACALFVRLHPLLAGLDDGVLASVGTLVEHGPTVWIDLHLAEEELRRQTRGSDRNRLNKLGRSGFSARIDERWDHLEDFLRIYAETMAHVGADESYLFGRDYFLELRGALGSALHLCVVEQEGRTAAAGLFSECRGIVQFHLSGTADEFRRVSPARLMIDHVRWWAKARGDRSFHLGGGLGAREDSLFEFKAGFSELRATFRSWRAVCDADRYQALVARWAERVGAPYDPDLTGVFPAYRQMMRR